MSLQDDLASGSQYLAPRKSPSRQTLSNRRSKGSLHGDGATRGASLAHELAAALMPEPTAGSRLLADEFGIEFDEGAEGIDEDDKERAPPPEVIVSDELENALQQEPELVPNGNNVEFMNSDASKTRSDAERTSHKDPLAILSTDLENTNMFIENLRRMDAESSSVPSHSSSSTSELPLERLASDVIRRINDSAREREGQVRELREFEREFKRIAGQAGGHEILGELDELERIEEFADEAKEKELRQDSAPGGLNPVEEEEEPADWELDPHRVLGDEDTVEYGDPDRPESPSPVKDSSTLPPPPLPSIPTPANTVTQLAYMRTLTQSLINSLSTVVEHTQVTGAATADAGRKIRALKNKIGGWRAEWESAERSMERIEKWESGGAGSPFFNTGSPTTAPNGLIHGKGRRMKQIMEEELSAFELVLAEAGRKTQAIMAAY